LSTTAGPAEVPHAPRDSRSGGSAALAAALPLRRRLYWSVRRELWENRYLYVVPLIIAGVLLFGFAVGAARLSAARAVGSPLGFIWFALMLANVILTVIYCLGALHNERFDRSILFWKSLPVADLTTVIAKASIPLLVIPLITFAVVVATQGILLLGASAVLLGRGGNVAALWAQNPLLPMWGAMLYHLATVHALYYAPVYGWLLLVSGWARRAAFLWAILPMAAILIIERLVFDTSVFAHMLLSRLGGGPAALPYPPPANMPLAVPTIRDLAAFLTGPGLWVGLAVFALFIAAAARLRRYQGPI
jgi:ABC-2 type transport system permease protein